MSQVFHDIEKKIINSLKENPIQTPETLENSTQLSPDQIRRGIEWLKLKDLAIVDESKSSVLRLGKNGLDSFEKGLPERRLLNLIKSGPKKLSEIQKELGFVFGPAIGLCRKNNWIETSSDQIILKTIPSELPGEKSLQLIGNNKLPKEQTDKIDLSELLKRPDFILEDIIKNKKISLTQSAKSLDVSNISGAIDVEAEVPEVFVARTHPLKDTIDEIREIFVTLGFSEILGNMTQSSFWNFDALFTPQDHPARELQDTFFLDGISAKKIANPEQIRKVSDSHKKNWRYQWDINEARKMVLRTHTTCVTIKHLAENKPDEARIFSLGRVFRNEKVSYKHLVEFNQIEGIVVGKDANLRNLMGIQREFYKRIGITKIKFWPTFFPYTEPSLQTMVYNEKLGKWIELFGMGIFRPEVTKPLGITKPVLAWGGGIERIAMLKYDLDDVREFYNNNLGWLRSNTKCQ
ncbi:MAG: phenylalanine--tRNA ligase subunit alpha [Nitrosopumilus sp.]|uniref:phenylalanine--tRNA ligase n=1 Tax=uncultured marine thaumarchaeote KM3_70_D10 TaxID=1456253 RepID=A0A075HHT4_9ARCH|nr:phenylalanyl-tRNA synthetase subunit alpha (FARSA, pheS) [uncultured marine thaumarchaeote KM3_70_D10]MCH1548903.1 phenylalanine--tRNA ligase subunit alpha [Nitrosopumilus sp.]RCL30439.1 MAG: phenylalanine--tRNA ligase subunit alpha [Nitrosopumilus sp.]